MAAVEQNDEWVGENHSSSSMTFADTVRQRRDRATFLFSVTSWEWLVREAKLRALFPSGSRYVVLSESWVALWWAREREREREKERERERDEEKEWDAWSLDLRDSTHHLSAFPLSSPFVFAHTPVVSLTNLVVPHSFSLFLTITPCIPCTPYPILPFSHAFFLSSSFRVLLLVLLPFHFYFFFHSCTLSFSLTTFGESSEALSGVFSGILITSLSIYTCISFAFFLTSTPTFQHPLRSPHFHPFHRTT